ncbi:TPA: hypothetical protein ACODJE_003901, partial [Salmonella enterica subsp. salamae serovar 42:g,t:-]
INYPSRYTAILINDMTFASRDAQAERPGRQDRLFNIGATPPTTFELDASSGIITLRFISSGPL